MLRLLLTPRWLGGTVLALVAVAICVSLGTWQFDRAHQKPRPVAIEDERVIPYADVAQAPADVPFLSGLLVRASGRYSDDRFTVTGPDASGSPAAWAATTLEVDAPAASGDLGAELPGALTVVRGDARPVPSAPVDGDVVITGRLQPPTSDGRGLDAASLVARGTDPRGYLVLVAQVPADARPATPADSPVPLRSPGLRWQNSVYAAQWFLFAGFVVFLWFRIFREELRDLRAGGRPVAAAGD